MRYIFLLILVVPAAEIAILLTFGNLIGVWPTVALILLTGVVGAYLAKRQGLEAIRKAQLQMQNGQVPGEALLDGICILIGGILLLTPGFLTDLTGLLLLAPATKKLMKKLIMNGIKKRMEQNTFTIYR